MEEYFIFDNGVQMGPYSIGQLEKMFRGKMISDDTVVRISGGSGNGRCVSICELVKPENAAGNGDNTARLLN